MDCIPQYTLLLVGAVWLCFIASPPFVTAIELEELDRVEDSYGIETNDKWLENVEDTLKQLEQIRIQQGIARQKRVTLPLLANNLKEVKITAQKTLEIKLRKPHGTIESLEWGYYEFEDLLTLAESIRTNRVKAIEVQTHVVSGEGIVPCKEKCKIHGWIMRIEFNSN